MTSYAINFAIMTAIASLHFVEARSKFAQYYIKLASLDSAAETLPDGQKPKCAKLSALCANSKVPLKLAWPMLFQVFFQYTLTFMVFPAVIESEPLTFIDDSE